MNFLKLCFNNGFSKIDPSNCRFWSAQHNTFVRLLPSLVALLNSCNLLVEICNVSSSNISSVCFGIFVWAVNKAWFPKEGRSWMNESLWWLVDSYYRPRTIFSYIWDAIGTQQHNKRHALNQMTWNLKIFAHVQVSIPFILHSTCSRLYQSFNLIHF